MVNFIKCICYKSNRTIKIQIFHLKKYKANLNCEKNNPLKFFNRLNPSYKIYTMSPFIKCLGQHVTFICIKWSNYRSFFLREFRIIISQEYL